jgi:predicted Ser/Thr protein kinase
MTPEQWNLARALFDAALERPRAARAAFIDAASATDSRIDAYVRDEVRAMLAADEATETQETGLACAAPDLLAQLDIETEADERGAFVGIRVGPWKLVRELGHGGMGAVYLGERVDGDFAQRAAIKLVRTGWDARELQRRFRSERRILASLDHPNIARLIDGGETVDGKPYLAMEFVDGKPLCAHCDAQRLRIAERLRLFIAICAAVAQAHRSLIVHRDLKPSNILVNTDGEVKLLDFGIARLLAPGTHATGSALRMFTPEYAAPEQVRGDPVTTSVDVYALGLMLYELLTGRRPYGQTASTPAAYERAILIDEPVRPSLLAQVQDAQSRSFAHARALEPNQLGASLRGDLDAIVLKALRKEPAQRYASVEALADDVQRYLQRQPVLARRGHWRYRGARFLQRHWLAAALGALALAGILSGLALALWQADKARRQEVLAQNEASKARAVANFMTGVFKAANPGSNDGSNPRASELLEHAVARLDAQTDLDAGARAGMLMAMGGAYLSMDDHPRGLTLMRSARQSALQGDDTRLRIETQLELARALDTDGQSTAALDELQQAQGFVADDPRSDATLKRRFEYVLAVVYNNLDRPTDALPPLERAYRDAIAADGLGAAVVGKFVDLYSVLLVSVHRGDEAIRMTQANYEASRRRDKVPLVERSNFAAAYGYALLDAGRPADAEVAYREALALDEQLFGVGNLATDISMNNVSAALRHQGKYVAAAELGERVLAMRRAHLAPDSAAIARSLAVLGNTYGGAGDLHKAIALMREAIAIFDQRHEDDRASAITARLNLARALEADGQYGDALQAVDHVLPHTQRSSSQYAGAGGADVRLMHARLQVRAAPDSRDCSAIASVLEVAPADAVEAVEAHILAADCEWRNRRAEQGKAHLASVDAPGVPLGKTSAYAQERLSELRRTMR